MRERFATLLHGRHLCGFDGRSGRALGIWMSAIFLASGSAFGDDGDFAGPPNPVPNITLEQCVGACFGVPFDDPKGTCQGLIKLNLFDFKEKYEVSAPTTGMTCALDQTSQYIRSVTETPYANPFAESWFSDDIDFQIYEIEHEGYEVVDLQQGHKYTGLMINK